MNIWDILGIPETQDIKTIKSAYASKAKRIDREVNPDEFMQLHDAYKMALAHCRNNEVSIPSAVEEKAEEKTEESSFDFGKIDSTMADSIDGHIIDDIIAFRTENHLDDMAVIRRLSQGAFTMMANQMTAMYCALARETDDETVWDSFVEEPLISSVIIDPGFRNFWKSMVPDDSKHKRKIELLCEDAEETFQELKKKEKERNDALTEESNRRLKLRNKGLYVVIAGLILNAIAFYFMLTLAELGLILFFVGFTLCIVGGSIIIKSGLLP